MTTSTFLLFSRLPLLLLLQNTTLLQAIPFFLEKMTCRNCTPSNISLLLYSWSSAWDFCCGIGLPIQASWGKKANSNKQTFWGRRNDFFFFLGRTSITLPLKTTKSLAVKKKKREKLLTSDCVPIKYLWEVKESEKERKKRNSELFLLASSLSCLYECYTGRVKKKKTLVDRLHVHYCSVSSRK